MPDWKQMVRDRLNRLKIDGASEAEIFDELAQHLEDRYQELLASGMSETDARELTIEPLDQSPSLVEALERARPAAPEPPSLPGNAFASLTYDMRMALRGMRHKPGFSLLRTGLPALGIAANSAIFSACRAILGGPDALARQYDRYGYRSGR